MTAPVQVLVVGFDEPSFSGEVLAELTRLRDAGVVRLVDVLLVRRDEDGTFDTLPPPQGADPDLGRIAARRARQPTTDDASPTRATGRSRTPYHPAAWPPWHCSSTSGRSRWSALSAPPGGQPLGELWLSPEDRARI